MATTLLAPAQWPLFLECSPIVAMTNFANDAVLQRFMSVYGIATFADHDNDGNADAGVLDDAKLFSIAFIAGMLSDKYSFAALQQSPMMIEVDAVITLRELCLRRGNAPPSSLEFRYQEITGKDGLLERIAAGKLKLVDANGERILQRNSSAPQHANLQIDRRFAEGYIRVVDTTSNMSTTQLKRFVDRWRSIE